MVEAALTSLTTTEAGAQIDTSTYYSTANTNGHTFLNDGQVIVFCTNTDGAVDPVLTVTYQAACAYGVNHSRTYTMTHGQSHVIGPFSQAHFNDANNLVHLACGATNANTKFFIIRKGQTMG